MAESAVMAANNGWGASETSADAVSADVYQPMTAGNDGDLLTTAIADNGDFPPTGNTLQWVVTDTMRVSTDIDMTFPTAVNINGNDETPANPLSWRWRNEFERNFITLQVKSGPSTVSYRKIMTGCYIYMDLEQPVPNQHDIVQTDSFGGYFSVLQVVTISGDLTMRAHSSVSFASTFSDPIIIQNQKLYWVNLLYDAEVGATTIFVFDPANNFAEIASPVTAAMDSGDDGFQFKFGRPDAHGDTPTDSKNSYIGQIMINTSGDPIVPIIGSGSSGGWANGLWNSNKGWGI